MTGDVFNTQDPTPLSQEIYYDFLDEVSQACPELRIIIIAGNHDNPSLLEAPKSLLHRHKVEVRGTASGCDASDQSDSPLLIPVDKGVERVWIIAVPYLRRSNFKFDQSYEQSVADYLSALVRAAREKSKNSEPVVMMAHLYASGSLKSNDDSHSETIYVGGEPEIKMSALSDRPDFLLSGHIHKRMSINDVPWAQYTGSALPMSFTESDYEHGADLLTFQRGKDIVHQFLAYSPYCASLTEILIPDGVTEIGANAFAGCHNLDSITVSSDNPVFDSREECNALIETETGTLILGSNHTTIPTSVSKIGDAAFCGLSDLTEIQIPEGVTQIGERAFYGCTALTRVRIPNSVKLIGNEAFKGCPTIPEGMTEIEDFWFYHDENLTRVDIPASVTSIGEDAFVSCINIKEITVSPENKRYDSRDDCNGIVETASNVLVLGCENTIIPDSVSEIGIGAFSGCPGLREINIPKGVTRIGEGAFFNCVGLCRVFIPDTVVEVGENAFAGCRNLVSLLAPEGLDLRAAKVPRRKGCKILTRYSPEHPPMQSMKSLALQMTNGDSIPVECKEQIDGRMSVTNWPSILEIASNMSKEDVEDTMKGYPYDALPSFILSVLYVLKGGYDRIPDILPWLDCISDSSLQDELVRIMAPVLDTLTERECDVFVHFYGIGCPRMTLSAIGARLHFTEERIRQIKEKALRRVRVFTARSAEEQ